MASIIRSDFSSPASSCSCEARTTSSGRRHVTQLYAVTGNGARDGSFQINGHVADRVHTSNIKYLIVSCQCDISKAIVSSDQTSSLALPRTVKPYQLRGDRSNSYTNLVTRSDNASLMKQRKNIEILSRINGQKHNICAIFPYNVRDNFISDEIVNRIDLRTRIDTKAARTIIWNSERFCSDGTFVEMSFSVAERSKGIFQRFHVLNNCPFDMILGSVTTGTATTAVLMVDGPYFYGALDHVFTYDHRTLRTELPVRSAVFKQCTGEPVL